jgi:drug/metabolite transporter (DMT)-like permease
VVVSQAVGLALAIAILVFVGERNPGAASVAWAIAGGAAGFTGLLFFYRGLAGGAMGLVAPVAALIGAGLPVVAGSLTGDHLRPTEVVGITLALVAVALVSRPAQDRGIGRAGLALALAAGVGFGLFFIAMGRSTAAGGQTWWPIVASRGTSLALGAAMTIALRLGRATLRAASPLMALTGLADLSGNAFFLLANSQGALGIAAVVSSQYPAVTAILARVVLHERLARIHILGIALALLGIALIAAP